jgi:glycosyltransferase involved in cell wall biosynthesis
MSKLALLIPTFNDWQALERLLEQIDEFSRNSGLWLHVCIVNDGSTIPAPPGLQNPTVGRFDLEILNLRRNLGHQRAIAVGLVHLAKRTDLEAAVVMDGDGEDSPASIRELLARFHLESGKRVVFAERARRAESSIFKIFYVLYKVLHVLVTGRAIRFGNFSIVPALYLPPLIVSGDLWNHYAAAVVNSRIPYCGVQIPRAKRLFGKSKMNFISLVTHGLSAISVYGETVGVRLLTIVFALGIAVIAGIAGIVYIRFGTQLAIPGWATTAAAFLIVLLAQLLITSFVLVVLILHSRSATTFVPIRDCHYFVDPESHTVEHAHAH